MQKNKTLVLKNKFFTVPGRGEGGGVLYDAASYKLTGEGGVCHKAGTAHTYNLTLLLDMSSLNYS